MAISHENPYSRRALNAFREARNNKIPEASLIITFHIIEAMDRVEERLNHDCKDIISLYQEALDNDQKREILTQYFLSLSCERIPPTTAFFEPINAFDYFCMNLTFRDLHHVANFLSDAEIPGTASRDDCKAVLRDSIHELCSPRPER